METLFVGGHSCIIIIHVFFLDFMSVFFLDIGDQDSFAMNVPKISWEARLLSELTVSF